MTASAYDTIRAYHEATKHHFNRYARSAGYMDWANQPNPFRFYEGAEKVALPLSEPDPPTSYGQLFDPVTEAGHPLSLKSLSIFLGLSLGLSAWKQSGASRWSLRINPSSGNLHPTEAHLVVPAIPGMDGGVVHYLSFEHALERRASLPDGLWHQVASHFKCGGFLVALSTIYWRESWKYGERAFRYCQLDAGHALAALGFAARLLDWELVCLTGAGDRQIRTLLGFDRVAWPPLEEEVAELLCWVRTDASPPGVPQNLPDHLVAPFTSHFFSGTPNRLSREPVDWAVITKAAQAVEKPPTAPEPVILKTPPPVFSSPPDLAAAQVIRQRRSAVGYQPEGSISLAAFHSILRPTLAQPGIAPFGMRLMRPCVHLLLFVHRVDGLDSGLYMLVRQPEQLESMQFQWREDFLWQQVRSDLPLYKLQTMDATSEAMALSCHQEIAGHSAFAVAMVAAFGDIILQAPYKYRHLHWECGMIGQVLYLAAEAHGIRATGIGCFFDDPVHRLLGIQDNRFQVLYHFTAGHPVEDLRLKTLPAYHHLNTANR